MDTLAELEEKLIAEKVRLMREQAALTRKLKKITNMRRQGFSDEEILRSL